MSPARGASTLDQSFNDSGFVDDGAAYVDAATVALGFASVDLGRAPVPPAAVRATAPVLPAELREVMGCFVTGVCVLTTVADGHDVAMTANSVTSVSLDPPLILVCVARTARFHHAIVTSRTWGVSVLDANALEISHQFARPGRASVGQLDLISHHRGEATGVALLASSVAALECRTESVYPGGDHSIVVGRVVTTNRRGEADNPLLFHHGGYRWLER